MGQILLTAQYSFNQKNNLKHITMKKSLIFVQLIIILLLQTSSNFGQSVEKDWVLYPNIVKFNTSPPVISSLPNISPPYVSEYTDSNGAFDETGNLLFFIVDTKIFDNTGTLVGYLLDANAAYENPFREINIVPVPGNSSQYYIIYSLGKPFLGQHLLYATIECTNGTCTILNNANLLSQHSAGDHNGIAVSRLFSDNTRRMYLASYDFIKRFEISSTAITFEENILTSPNTYGLIDREFETFQLEISNNCSMLAWGSFENTTNIIPKLNIIELDNDGSLSNYYSILPSDNNFQPDSYHTIIGVEFASDNSKVYFNVSNYEGTGGIFCYNFDLELLSNIIYDEYNVTQLQSDANGYIYAVSNDGSDMGKIDPVSNIISTEYLDINNLSTVVFAGNIVYALPDLIDYNSILTLNATSTYESCAGNSDGTVTVTVNGGVPPYTFQWNDQSVQTSPTAINLSPGLYTCTVTDALNESTSISVEVSTDPSLFTHIGDWEVYTYDGFDGFAAFDGNIEIFDGGIFVVNGIAEFNTNKGIIIHEGGTLMMMENSVVSGLAACNNNNWDGVLVKELATIYIDNVTTISKGDLIIDNDAEVQFQYISISFEDNNIILKQGAELTIQNSTFTSLSATTWNGIQVWGNSGESQVPIPGQPCAQGKLIVKNKAVIENARIAVDLWEPNNWNSTGGIVIAENSFFINNARAVRALNYTNFDPNTPSGITVWDNESYFNNCVFDINTNYIGMETFYKHIDLSNVKGFSFKGCDFTNTATNNISAFNCGIMAMDAGFSVEQYCNYQPCTNGDESHLSGFYSAVWAANERTTNTFLVSNANFTENATGVKANGVDNAAIISSHFGIGYNNNPFSKEECLDRAISYGIDMLGSIGFAIEDNDFTPTQTDGIYIGIRIKDSYTPLDLVYQNRFDGLSYGNFSEGMNRSTQDDDLVGLEFQCNINTDNNIDFIVTSENPEEDLPQIRTFQGTQTMASGNKFSANAQWHFKNDGFQVVDYFYCTTCTDETPVYYTPQLILPVESDYNTCPPHYGGSVGTEKSVLLSPEQIQQTEQDFVTNQTDFENIEVLFNNLKDGGNTDALTTEVEMSWPEDMWELRTELLGNSPHLSKEVLMAAADKTEVLPESVLFEILAANSDELRKGELISHLENKEQPLPEYMINILKQVAGGITYKTVLLQEMTNYNRAKTQAAYDLIRSSLNDSINDNQYLRNWLANLNNAQADMQIVSTYRTEGDFASAQTLLDLIPGLYMLEGKELIEYNEYKSFTEMQMGIQQQGRNIFQLEDSEITTLVNYAENSNGKVAYLAQGILEYAYDFNFCNCAPVGDSSILKNSYVEGVLSSASGLLIDASPNPATTWVTFDFELPVYAKKAILQISDIEGKIITTFTLSIQQKQYVWDTRNWEKGVYIYTLKTTNESKSGKLIIQ
jgi:hypothetical protein